MRVVAPTADADCSTSVIGASSFSSFISLPLRLRPEVDDALDELANATDDAVLTAGAIDGTSVKVGTGKR